MTERWFTRPQPGPDAEVLLFCLPFAGGGSTAYRRWPKLFSPRVDIQPVLLPGREARIAEPARIDPAELTAALVRRADRPFALYGHSMGGCLAFEVVRELRRRGGPLPVRLAVGGSRPPDAPADRPEVADLPDEEFAAYLVSLGGTPAEVFADPDLRELLLPAVRTDLRWLRDYVCVAAEPLPVPVDGFVGTEDRVVPAAAMAGWARHTSAGFTLHPVPGGHLLVQEPPPELVSRLTADLLASAVDPAVDPAAGAGG